MAFSHSASKHVGIYLHWPFCEAKCPYCDFNSHVVRNIDQSAWKRAYLSELARYKDAFPDAIVKTVYFGGGTPSLMDPATVSAILDKIAQFWRASNDVEVTLEANPSSVEAARFAAYRAGGVNRVSLGVQALNDTDLQKLGRLHSVHDARRALDIALSTFERASFDLIYARQGQSLEAWRAELEEALTFGFQHLSLYQLTVEDGTAFSDRMARGKLPGLPDEDVSADMFDETVTMCTAVGLEQYEVSNFAVPCQESQHNQIYWSGGAYFGIGPGAHGRIWDDGGARIATTTHLAPGKWLDAVQNGNGEDTRVPLTAEERCAEYLMMGLRTSGGISLSMYEAIGGAPLDRSKLSDLNNLGIVSVAHDKITVEKQYVKVLNSIISQLLVD